MLKPWTTDRNDEALKRVRQDGQQEAYLVLSEEDRAAGFSRPVRHIYKHLKCGYNTRVSNAIAETWAADIHFYSEAFCCYCKEHFPLIKPAGSHQGLIFHNFIWEDGIPVGS